MAVPEFKWDIQIVQKDMQNYKSNCADIVFINQGTATVIVFGILQILPNATLNAGLALPAFGNELCVNNFPIKFDTSTGIQKYLVILRKRYNNK